jgi:ATP-dependent RNA helicase RhlE
LNTFSKFALHDDIQRGIVDMGFTTPTPIQNDTIAPALEGRDILACAMTGSGKTAAFVLPIIQRLLRKRNRATRALIVTPTRELAAQITEHIVAMAYHTSVKSASVYGGVAMGPQQTALRRGVDIVIATPGRLLDHLQYSYANLSGLEMLVLDEADRMLDMGFLPDIRRILGHLPERRQTLFFSATLPPPIVALSKEMLTNAVAVNVGRVSKPAVGITQSVYSARSDLKSDLLLELLNRGSFKSVLVFTRTKHRANRVALFLQKHGVACERIHGNRTQNQRTDALAGFKSGQFQVLVATDVAARGIDVEAISHVINYDVPDVPDSYIHRVGRTARAELTGDALTFVSADEEPAFRDIERVLGKPLPRLKLEGFDYTTRRAKQPGAGRSEPTNGHRTRRAPAYKSGSKSRGSNGSRSNGSKSRTEGTPDRLVKFATETPKPKPKRPAGGYGRRSRPDTKNSRRPVRRGK